MSLIVNIFPFQSEFTNMKAHLVFFLILITWKGIAQTPLEFKNPVKQRVLVLTDITNEPDDQQSLVRFLVYSNEYDVEGIVATTSTHLRDNTRKDKIEDLLMIMVQLQTLWFSIS